MSTKFVNIEDLRRAARWNMPKAMFDFVDGGANAEWTQRRNSSEFERIMFDPRVLVDVSDRDQSTTVFGQKMQTPIFIAPTGLTSIAWPNAELLAARAAQRAGAGLALSTYASNSLEEIAEVGTSPGWLKRFLKGPRPAYRNISGNAALTPKQFVELGYQLAREIDPSVNWEDIENFRAR